MTSSRTILVRYTVKLLSEQLFSRVPIVNKNALIFLIFSVRREGGKGDVKVNQLPFTSEILNISSKKNVNRKKSEQMQLFYLLLQAAARKFVILLASRIRQISADYT